MSDDTQRLRGGQARALACLRRGGQIALVGDRWELQMHGYRIGVVHWATVEALLASGAVRREGLVVIFDEGERHT